ncbi:hypothetical protein FQA39_LY16039 [Lamprigera yunnana]|nr:hypothetical protein FQA39_LY16039 [Lamprigera yunnana]
MWLLILVASLFAIFYHYIIKPMNYWKTKNVKYIKPQTVFGLTFPVFPRKKTKSDDIVNMYKMFPDERYVGTFNFTSPVLLIRDPELLKLIMVKEFHSFSKHIPLIADNVDPMWNNNLFAIQDIEKWHPVRKFLSPSFTTSKLKNMFTVIKEHSKEFLERFSDHYDIKEVNIRDLFLKCCLDISAKILYGINCDFISEPENEYCIMGQALNRELNNAKFNLSQNYNIPFLGKKVKRYYQKLISNMIQTRNGTETINPSLFGLLATSDCKNSKIEINVDTLSSQAFLYTFTTSDSVSTLMTFTLYELALNPDVQEKLYKEVHEAMKKRNNNLSYYDLMNLRYLDMVVSESLRKWPPFVVTDRKTSKPFMIGSENADQPNLLLEEDTDILIPVKGIHTDPKYYPNPEKFDPERFNKENRQNIQDFTYIPFGMGPRNCIALRFAILECKIVIAEVINKFKIFATPKTKEPLVLGKYNFTPTPEEGEVINLAN